jgi:hypothetical protein
MTAEFERKVESLTDGQMISRMARENSARRKFDISVIREAIGAAVEAHGKGLILPTEMEIKPRTDPKVIRNAPKYVTTSESEAVAHPYTLESLAKLLGFVKQKAQQPTHSFIAAFGAEELIADRVFTESQIKGLSGERGSASFRLPVLVRYRAPLRALSEVIMSEG